MRNILKRKIFKVYTNIHKDYHYLMLLFDALKDAPLCVQINYKYYFSQISLLPSPLPHRKSLSLTNDPFKYKAQ